MLNNILFLQRWKYLTFYSVVGGKSSAVEEQTACVDLSKLR